MTSEEYIKLYQKYISGKCSQEEERVLMEYNDGFKVYQDTSEKLSSEEKTLGKNIYNNINQTISGKKVKSLKFWYRWSAAALMVMSLGTAFYFFGQKQVETNALTVLKTKTVARPDSGTAVLTLADGSMIPLDEAKNGLLTHEGGTEILKTKNGELTYKGSENEGNAFTFRTALNRISIPSGRQYKLVLADGTKVWLNATSSLSYPSEFSGTERNVELSGEGYFEVAKNEKMPFIVTVGKMKVHVLGTHFNISAYDNDLFVKTTLAEGSVRLTNGDRAVILKPGQQGLATVSNENIDVKKVNLQHVLAWKGGYFMFRDDNIKEVMKQISRWYNVKVEYEDNIDEKVFGGIYAKSKDLEELLKGLELTGLVKFRIIDGKPTEERRIIVTD
ncbi:FecR family protein [Pedobacter arcticus]|uniref:FecR family protein n=1 Tax=Pedobacter arcticus TaxID=752140 RepID=UPI0002E68779|nr:FecR family protein [Pedobacter arcticus]